MGAAGGHVLVDGSAGPGRAARRRAGRAGCGRRAGLARLGAGDGAPVQSRARRGGARGVADGAGETEPRRRHGEQSRGGAPLRPSGPTGPRGLEGEAERGNRIGGRPDRQPPIADSAGDGAGRQSAPPPWRADEGAPASRQSPPRLQGQHKKGRPHQRPPLPRLIGGRPERRPPISYSSSSSSLRRRMANSRMRRAPRLARAMQLSRSMLSPVCGSIFQRPSRSSHTSL